MNSKAIFLDLYKELNLSNGTISLKRCTCHYSVQRSFPLLLLFLLFLLLLYFGGRELNLQYLHGMPINQSASPILSSHYYICSDILEIKICIYYSSIAKLLYLLFSQQYWTYGCENTVQLLSKYLWSLDKPLLEPMNVCLHVRSCSFWLQESFFWVLFSVTISENIFQYFFNQKDGLISICFSVMNLTGKELCKYSMSFW